MGVAALIIAVLAAGEAPAAALLALPFLPLLVVESLLETRRARRERIIWQAARKGQRGAGVQPDRVLESRERNRWR